MWLVWSAAWPLGALTSTGDSDIQPSLRITTISQLFSKCGSLHQTSGSPRSLFERQTLWPPPRCAESETLGVSPEICVFKSPPVGSATGTSLRTVALS
jgi:hypothetical protein